MHEPDDIIDAPDWITAWVRWTDAVYGGGVFAFPTSTHGDPPDAWGPSVFERAWPSLAEAAGSRLPGLVNHPPPGVPHGPAIPGAWTTDGTTDAVDAVRRADIVQMGRRPGKTALGAARAAGAVSKRDQASARKWWRG